MYRSKKWREAQGWHVDIVERHIRHCNITMDFLDRWDPVAIRPGSPEIAWNSSHKSRTCQRAAQEDQRQPTSEGVVLGKSEGPGARLEREG